VIPECPFGMRPQGAAYDPADTAAKRWSGAPNGGPSTSSTGVYVSEGSLRDH